MFFLCVTTLLFYNDNIFHFCSMLRFEMDFNM